ncbi:outer membrane protein [Sphingorhabdus arenilitoris]|uniref:Outer membrane protein n=1 Tax=Sphingorhabdus arenilitoris TaxID=1490041 RepID=A0ABV8RFT6_9SPHN
MRNLTKIVTVTACSLIAGTAHAGEPYIGGSVGVTLPDDSQNRGETTAPIAATADFPAIPSGTPVEWRTGLDSGFDLNLMGGYRFDNGFRVELQGFYNENGVDSHTELLVGGANIDGVDSAVLTRGAASATNPLVGDVLAVDDGKLKTYGAMANIYYDFNKEGALQPYIGAGAGVQVTDVRFIPSGVDVANDDATVFAWQGMAGLTYKIGPSMEVFGQYTYRSADRARIALNLLPADLEVDSDQSILSLGVRIPFGGK